MCVFTDNDHRKLRRAGKCVPFCSFFKDATETSLCPRYVKAKQSNTFPNGHRFCAANPVTFFSSAENQKSTLIKGKTFSTPLPPSGRRALGVVTENATPSVQPREKKLLKPQVGRFHKRIYGRNKSIYSGT